MDEFHYDLLITGSTSEEVTAASHALEEQGIVPNTLKKDTSLEHVGNSFYLSLSTDFVSAYGTVPCWSNEEHEKLLNEVSLKIPGVTLKLTGENLDDPNNSLFVKAFQNGLYKEVYQEKQDIEAVLENTPWELYGAPAREGQEAAIFSLYGHISLMRNNEHFQIASDMAYMADYITLDNPLSDNELYALATKLSDVNGIIDISDVPVLHEELLDSIRYMLEYGLTENHSPYLPELSADDTRKLLLSADVETFAQLAVIGAVDNQRFYNDVEDQLYYADLSQVEKAIESIKNTKPPLSEKIATAQKAVCETSKSVEKSVSFDR